MGRAQCWGQGTVVVRTQWLIRAVSLYWHGVPFCVGRLRAAWTKAQWAGHGGGVRAQWCEGHSGWSGQSHCAGMEPHSMWVSSGQPGQSLPFRFHHGLTELCCPSLLALWWTQLLQLTPREHVLLAGSCAVCICVWQVKVPRSSLPHTFSNAYAKIKNKNQNRMEETGS